MFTLQNWVLSAPPCHAELGHETDNLLHTITIASDLDSNWACKLDAEQPSYGICNVIDLVGDGGTLSADITADMFPAEGEWNLQVRAMKGDVVAHSTICTVRVGRSLNAIDFFPPMEPSEMAQMEARVTALKMQAEQAAANATDSAQDAQDAKTGAEAAQAAAEAARADAEHQSDLAAAWAVASQLARNEAQQAQAAAEDAQAAAEAAKAGALAAESGVQASKEAAQAAQTAAETAQGKAEDAEEGALAAQSGAESAESGAQAAQSGAAQSAGEAEGWAGSAADASALSRVWAEGEYGAYDYGPFTAEPKGAMMYTNLTTPIGLIPGAQYKVTVNGQAETVTALVGSNGYGRIDLPGGIEITTISADTVSVYNGGDTAISGELERLAFGFTGTGSKQYAQQAGQRANSAAQSASSAAQSNTNAGNAAQQAESWAVGGTGTRDGEDTNNAKYWCEQAQEAGQGVSSFNNRTGAVTPQSGDYSADMIADLPIHKVVGTTDNPIDLLSIRPDGVYLFSGEFADRSEEFDAVSGIVNFWDNHIMSAIAGAIVSVVTMQGMTGYMMLLSSTGYTWVINSNGTLISAIDNSSSFDNRFNEKINSNEITLSASSWSGETAPYTQTVTAYVGPYENGLITMAKNATDEQYLAAAKAKIRVDSQPGSGNLTLKATGEKPNINIPVVVVGWNNTTGGSNDPDYYIMDGLPQDIGGGDAGVTSFAGRTGAVTPQSGDYTAAMVGALPTSGGTMTGVLHIGADTGVYFDSQGKEARLQVSMEDPDYKFELLAGTASIVASGYNESITLSGVTCAAPTSASGIANKQYVDNKAASVLPASGTDGQVLTKTASGVAWQDAPASGGKRICRYVVGTSSAGWTAADCDYLCDGTDDQVEINAALAALPAGGGEVRLLDGTYHLSGAITAANGAVKLSGCGKSTILEPQLTSEAPHAFELSCPSFRLEQAAVHLTYVGAVSILLSAEVALFQGTSAVEEISLAGCEIDNLILYYVKAPATAKFTMEDCSSLATSPPTTAQPASLCMCEYRDCFFAHRIFLHQADSAVVNCSFDVPSTMTEPVILLYASALILGNRLRAVNAIEGSTGGRSTVTGNRITLRDGGSLLKPRIGITCYSGDLVQGNTVLREEGAAAFRATEYTIQVSEYAAAAAVLGNVIADKDVADNGTGTVLANNVVLTTV